MTCNYCEKSRRPEQKPNPYPEGTFLHACEDMAQAFNIAGVRMRDAVERYAKQAEERKRRRRNPPD